MGCSKSSSKRKIYSSTIVPQETRKISNKQSKLTPKGTQKRRTNKAQVSRGRKYKDHTINK